MTITVLFFCVIALSIGAIVGWVSASAKKGAETRRALAERETAVAARAQFLAERDAARDERARSDAARLELQRRLEEAQQARAAADARALEAEKAFASHGILRKQLEDAFSALAQRAFKDVGESLVRNNTTQVGGALETKKAEIDAMLTPMREMLEGYRAEVQRSERARNESYGGLQEQIRMLLAAQETAQREASRLANALQSPTVRGSWGENSLKRCVELAGMSEFCDFDTQTTFNTEDGRRQRPDLIVRLPNQRVIAVDAKVPLGDYTTAASEEDDTRKRELLGAHAKTLRRHIDSLSRKEYQSSVGDTLDFTVMYLPGEHFLSAALVTDPSLFEYAVERKIYLASPTVLLPLLRAVAAGWKAERTEENAKKLHDAGVELFNRFVRIMDLFAEVGARLGKTVEKFNETVRSIDTRLWPKGEELQRLAGSGKELGPIAQIEAVPLESSKLRLTMQNEEPGVVVAIRE
ncbi:MAG TPA: DNA recombination protein RmuC [Thermoanaerobaculia bacterium]|jgi:DNA recombination protein RmuC